MLLHCRTCTAVWVSLWEATGSGIRQLRGHGGRGKRIFESRFRVSLDCVSSPFRPCIRTVSAHQKITPRVAFFFGFGSYFFWFLGPKSAAVFRPHFLRTRLLNGAKRGPFSGRTFRVHEFAFFSFPARAGGYAEGRSEPLQNRRVWAAVSGHWSAHVSWTWIRWSVPFFIPAVHV